MPYINSKDRPKYDAVIDTLPPIESAGDLNYVITEICARYVLHRGLRYDHFLNVTAVLIDIALEFKRRGTNVYEDKKIRDNGDTPGFKRLMKALSEL